MKNITALFAVSFYLLFAPGCKEDELLKFIEIYPGIPTIQDWQDYNSYIMFEGVSIKLFQTKIDYLLDQNTYFQGTTDEKGRLYIDDKSDVDTLWCRTTYDTLNNLRYRR